VVGLITLCILLWFIALIYAIALIAEKPKAGRTGKTVAAVHASGYMVAGAFALAAGIAGHLLRIVFIAAVFVTLISEIGLGRFLARRLSNQG
jgi:hypothetical protein